MTAMYWVYHSLSDLPRCIADNPHRSLPIMLTLKGGAIVDAYVDYSTGEPIYKRAFKGPKPRIISRENIVQWRYTFGDGTAKDQGIPAPVESEVNLKAILSDIGLVKK